MEFAQRHTFEFILEAMGHRSAIRMDGQELRGVTDLQIKADVHGPTQVTLTFVPEKVLVRVNSAQAFGLIKELIAETTAMGDQNRTYGIAVLKADE